MRAASETLRLRVLRICSVFEVQGRGLAGRGTRFDPVGGMQNHTSQITRRLDALGVSQTVVTAHRPGAPRRERIGDASEVYRVGLPIPWLRQLYAGPALRLARQAAGRVDMVHGHLGEDLAVLPIACAAARWHRVPWIVTVHCSLTHTLRAVDLRTALLKRAGGVIERALLPQADAVITLTDHAAERLSTADSTVHVIPPGSDASRFTASVPDPFPDLGRPRFAFVGRLAKAKGVDVLIDSFARMRSYAELVVVGDGPDRERLELAAAATQQRVRFTGFLPQERIPAVLLNADVLVLPSRYEELGSILMDAMQARLPVVASAVGGIPAAIVDGVNGLLVPPGDAASLAVAMDRLASDVALRHVLARGAAARASLYDWDSVAERVLSVYDQVVSRAGPPMLAATRHEVPLR